MNTKLGKKVYYKEAFEANVLDFYDKALRCDTHYIAVHSFDYFQSLIASLLQTKLVYHNPAYITERTINIAGVYNPYKELSLLSEIEELQEHVLSKLFNDIIFIEQSAHLMTQSWYAKIITLIENNTKNNTIPIIIATL